ncbi:MAG: glycosyltransferase family 2 protein, partial [Saprospiraceae bacterium]|nr:glycosyltransferase family 2 protein [Saprospiraceae bacterium]
MIDLSIVIVNFNVKYFLAQCLNSILHSNLSGITTEILVIDNNSSDGSFPYLEERYGDKVTFIKNNENVGFGKACNQGIKKSQGNVLLFVNPDTIISDDTLSLSYNRLVKEDGLGALGVRMVDGRGKYLPESKRSFPTPINALLKLTGLDRSNLKMGTPYNLNHLNENEENYIDVLCGAFFMVKREVLNIVKGFDDDFFMYGEDIDLSLRIKKAGYKILYYPETSIIHFKGESHGKKDFKYYSRFYKAMSIYAEKHHSSWISILLKISIFLAGSIAIIKAYSKRWITIIIDGVLLTFLFYLMKHLWASMYYSDPNYYPPSVIFLIIACVISVIISLFIAGHYTKNASLR